MATINGSVRTRRSRAHRVQSARPATRRFRKQAAHVGHTVREMGGTAKMVAQEKLEEMRQTASDYYDLGRSKVHSVERILEAYIRESPVKSILIAAGVGMLLGGLWIRRR